MSLDARASWKQESETDSLLALKENKDSAVSLKSSQDGEKCKSIWEDSVDTLSLAVPVFISRLSWVGVSPSSREKCFFYVMFLNQKFYACSFSLVLK